MAKTYLLAIDQGTTGSTVLVVDASDSRTLTVIGRSTKDFPQHFPQTGWVEHDLNEIWASVETAGRQALAAALQSDSSFKPEHISGVGITNQRETTCVFDRKSGAPLARAIVWQCKRSSDICADMKKRGLEKEFRAATGLVLDPYFSGTKIAWLLANNPTVKTEVSAGRAVFGTIDTFLMHRLSGGQIFATEASNASRTLLYDINKGAWSESLAKHLTLPTLSALPEVKDSAGLFGKTKGVSFLPDGIPISGCAGDQQAALAGQTCFAVGEAKCTYGTGAFLLMNIGAKPLISSTGLLTTVAWSLGGKLTYAFEGSAFIAGAAVQFLRDQWQVIANAKETEALTRGSTGSPEVYFVPALAGLGAPYWDPLAHGAILGLTRGTTKGQLVRATLEGIAFQVCDLLTSMAQDAGQPLSVLRVDGGASANDVLMQDQADLSDIPVDRPKMLETTAMGAALFAGLGVGVFRSVDELATVRMSDRMFKPISPEAAKRAERLAGWKRAINAVQAFRG